MKRKMLVMLLVCGMMIFAGFVQAQTTTYTGPGSTNSDQWNNPANWTGGAVPSNAVDVVISTNHPYVTAWSASTPAYSGNLTMQDNTTLQLGWTTMHTASWNAIGTAGSTIITMGEGAYIKSRTQGNPSIPEIVLLGDARVQLGESTQTPAAPTFGHPITGAHKFTLISNASGPTILISASNSFSHLEIQAVSGRGGNHGTVRATVAGALGLDAVTIIPVTANGAAFKLELDASGVMSPTGTLHLAGSGPAGNGLNVLQLDADNTIGYLTFDGFAYPAGTYGRVGLGTVTNQVSWISGDSILTVLDAPEDNTPPALVSITDNAGGGPILDISQVTYTVTFSEPISGELTAADFEDGGTSGATIDSVTASTTSALLYTVTATPSQAGTLILQIKAGSVIEDLFGNPLDTSSAVADDTVITVNAVPKIWSQLGILSTNVFTQNFGRNPATGDTWKMGDTYRLAFVTTATTDATSTNIATYNAFVQSVAEGSSTFPNLGDVSWYAIGSTAELNARDNTQTVPGASPGDGPIYLLNGITQVAADYADLWDGSAANRIHKTEENIDRAKDTAIWTSWTAVWSGSGGSGLKSGNPLGAATVTHGLIYDAATMWISRATAANTNTLPMYAISEPLTVQGNAAGTVLIVK